MLPPQEPLTPYPQNKEASLEQEVGHDLSSYSRQKALYFKFRQFL